MKFHEVFSDLRKKAGLSQNDVAEKLFLTRQAVSRWEQGGTVPEPETLVALSKLFGVSVNTLLGTRIHKYCKWCWAGGAFTQECTLEEMVEICLPHMPLAKADPDACRTYMRKLLPTLERWNPA